MLVHLSENADIRVHQWVEVFCCLLPFFVLLLEEVKSRLGGEVWASEKVMTR
jgi:hypothetical protein